MNSFPPIKLATFSTYFFFLFFFFLYLLLPLLHHLLLLLLPVTMYRRCYRSFSSSSRPLPSAADTPFCVVSFSLLFSRFCSFSAPFLSCPVAGDVVFPTYIYIYIYRYRCPVAYTCKYANEPRYTTTLARVLSALLPQKIERERR